MYYRPTRTPRPRVTRAAKLEPLTPPGPPPGDADAALDADLLGRLAAAGRPVTLRELFERTGEGWTSPAPTWAMETAARLIRTRLVKCGRRDAALSLTATALELVAAAAGDA